MVPVNNVFLGSPDPLLSPMVDPVNGLDERMAMIEAYQKKLAELKQARAQMAQAQVQPQVTAPSLWEEIDAEVYPLSEEQKMRLAQDEEYAQNDLSIQQLVQTEILNLVKGKIENSQAGKELLNNQLSIVRKLKKKIVEDTNKEMEAFRKFKEYSKSHPNVTYEEFIKTVYQ
mgnify:CR=1 FL=1|jgi:hypothetical protein|nr:MAG TPA: hypothetical protein [Caudoviricetes sp.]